MPLSLSPLSGASTSIVKAAIPSCEFDLHYLGFSAWGQCWPRELGLGVSLCTDLLRCLVLCPGFYGVFCSVGWFCSSYQENSRIFALSSKRLSASRLVRRKLFSVTSFWQRGCVVGYCLQGGDGSEHLLCHGFLSEQAGGSGRGTLRPCSSWVRVFHWFSSGHQLQCVFSVCSEKHCGIQSTWPRLLWTG